MWFYLFQEPVLLRRNAKPTGYVPETSLKPSMDVLLEPPEAKINVQKFDTPTDPPKGVVFYLHGNRGNIHLCLWEIKPFVDAGYDVWTMDYRGFGKSTGTAKRNRPARRCPNGLQTYSEGIRRRRHYRMGTFIRVRALQPSWRRSTPEDISCWRHRITHFPTLFAIHILCCCPSSFATNYPRMSTSAMSIVPST